MSSSSLTRRNLFAVVPPALAAVSLPASGAAGPDGALLALRGSYERSVATMDKASIPHSAAEDAFYSMRSADPDRDERSIRKATGLVVAERAYHRALSANQAVIDQVTELPAVTIEGIRFKARISQREDNTNLDLLQSIVADLLVLGGGLDA